MAAQFENLFPKGDFSWIHDLARGENHPDAEKILNLGRTFDPQQLVEESTIDFLTDLRENFQEYSKVFNSYSEEGHKFQEVKIYSVAQTVADFMLFRSQVKLVVANVAHGVIRLSLTQHFRGTVAIDGYDQQSDPKTMAGAAEGLSSQPQDLLAQVGPFRNVFWIFQGEKISGEEVAKFYFAEFVRATRDLKRSRLGNQLLLDQIKALLQGKGLDL